MNKRLYLFLIIIILVMTASICDTTNPQYCVCYEFDASKGTDFEQSCSVLVCTDISQQEFYDEAYPNSR